jgi:hypothetical protein
MYEIPQSNLYSSSRCCICDVRYTIVTLWIHGDPSEHLVVTLGVLTNTLHIPLHASIDDDTHSILKYIVRWIA